MERKEQFTPVPWEFDKDTGFVDAVKPCKEGEEHDPVCEVWIGDKQPKGNGYLIAAAPEMYGKLAELESILRSTVPLLADDIAELLKKARGE